MSYGLLWIEGVAVALLWVATSLAVAARIPRRLWAGLFLGLSLAIVLLVFGGLLAGSGALKFALGLEVNWFAYCLWLFIAVVVGSLVILRVARRRPEPGMPRRAATWPVGRLALALAAAIALDAMTLWNMDLAVGAEAANLRIEAGAVLLSVAPPQVEDDRNAAVVYEKAFSRMQEDKSLRADDSPLNAESPDPSSPAVARLLDRHATTLRLLREAASRPACRFDRDYAHPSISMLLPELSQCRTAALLLSLDARHASASGDEPGAIEDVKALFRLSRAAGSDPIIVSQLVEIALDQRGIEVLEEILPRVRKSDELAGVQIGDAASVRRRARRALEGEEAFGLSIFSDLAAGRLTLAQITGAARTEGGVAMPDIPPLALLMRVFVMPSDIRAYQRYMESCRARVAQPYTAADDRGQEARLARRHGLLTSIILPALNRFIERVAESQALHAAARTGIAVARYRLDHGAFPPTLDALVPQYIDQVPLDPFDGRPLRFQVRSDQALIYSIGPDEKDDAGTRFDPQKRTGDILFTVKAKQ